MQYVVSMTLYVLLISDILALLAITTVWDKIWWIKFRQGLILCIEPDIGENWGKFPNYDILLCYTCVGADG